MKSVLKTENTSKKNNKTDRNNCRLLKARAFLNNAIPSGIHPLEKIISHIQ